jgi:hypothetical protein
LRRVPAAPSFCACAPGLIGCCGVYPARSRSFPSTICGLPVLLTTAASHFLLRRLVSIRFSSPCCNHWLPLGSSLTTWKGSLTPFAAEPRTAFPDQASLCELWRIMPVADLMDAIQDHPPIGPNAWWPPQTLPAAEGYGVRLTALRFVDSLITHGACHLGLLQLHPRHLCFGWNLHLRGSGSDCLSAARWVKLLSQTSGPTLQYLPSFQTPIQSKVSKTSKPLLT